MFLKIRKFKEQEEKISKGAGGEKKKQFPRVDRNSNPESNRLKAFLSDFDCPYLAKLCATFHRVGGKSSIDSAKVNTLVNLDRRGSFFYIEPMPTPLLVQDPWIYRE